MMSGDWKISESGLATRLRQLWSPEPGLWVPTGADAAVAVALTDEARPQVLLTRRAAHMRLHAGEVAFPGGRCDPGDADLLATALRESNEEVALAPQDFDYVGPLAQRQTRAGLRVRALLGVIPPGLPLRPNPDELDTLFYVPMDFFAEPANLQREVFAFGTEQRLLARYDWQGMRIWGLTAMMLMEMANKVYGADLQL